MNIRRSRLRPKTVVKSSSVPKARIDALTAAGRANWLALLAYLAFALITTLGVDDVDFFIDSRKTRLPLVGVSIPTFSFFVFAPILGAALYAYLHLHIRKVSEALAEAPIGKVPVEERIRPWLLNDFILRQRIDVAIRRRPLDWVVNVATLGLVWLAAPLVLTLMWWRTWPTHALWLTSLGGAMVIFTVYVGLRSWTKMRQDTGRGTRFMPVSLISVCVAVLLLGRGFTAGSGLVPPITNPSYPIEIVQYGMVSPANLISAKIAELPLETRDHVTAHLSYRQKWCALRGVPSATCQTLSTPLALQPRFDVAGFRQCAEKRSIQACFQASAPVDRAMINEWKAFRRAEIEALPRPDLSSLNLTAARLDYASLVGVDLFSSDFRGANFLSARMEQTDMRSSDLTRANLHFADLRGALLYWTTLDRARFTGASLYGAEFHGARGHRTSFNQAWLDDARLDEVELPESYFGNASLEYTYMFRSNFEGGHFSGARLAYVNAFRANLTEAQFQQTEVYGANLKLARLDDTFLYETRIVGSVLDDVTFNGARFDQTQIKAAVARAADFRGAKDLLQSQLDSVVGDARTLLPDEADPETGEPLFVLSCLPRETAGWEHLGPTFWRLSREDPVDAAERMNAILCAVGEVPRKTGTPWKADAPPPWEDNPDWQPEQRGSVPSDPVKD